MLKTTGRELLHEWSDRSWCSQKQHCRTSATLNFQQQTQVHLPNKYNHPYNRNEPTVLLLASFKKPKLEIVIVTSKHRP